ncbi:MAG: hypothetical protein SWN98_18590, partial [Pseudomonadota bacterium]|nr:hypothetical protein [Pseudomonadota bacterium]
MSSKRPALPRRGTARLDPIIAETIEARNTTPLTIGALAALTRERARTLGGRALVFVLTLGASMLCALPFLLLSGADLGVTARAFFIGSLGSQFAVAETLVQMIP